MGVEAQTKSEMHQIPAARDTQGTSAVTPVLYNDKKMREHVEIFSLVENIESK